MSVHLDRYEQGCYTPGAPFLTQLLWHYVGFPLVSSRLLPFSSLKIRVLRLFGAKIGCGVCVKPGVHIKFPWRLSIGDHSWIGENSWFDNLAEVRIGRHCCISQGAYFCTGNHDWQSPGFALLTNCIEVADYAWLAAKSMLGPGTRVGEGAVLTMGSVANDELRPWTIYRGIPAVAIKERKIISPTTQSVCSEQSLP